MDDIIRNKDKLMFEVDSYSYKVILRIKCNNDPDLFDMLQLLAPYLQEPGVRVSIIEPKVIAQKKVKSEFVEIDKHNRERDEELQQELEALMNRLRARKMDVDRIRLIKYQTPDYYQEVESETIDYSNAGIVVTCHYQTRFYQTMFQTGII